MFVTSRYSGDVITMTLADDSRIVVKVQGFRVGDDGRLSATLAFGMPEDVFIEERQLRDGRTGPPVRRIGPRSRV